MKLQLDGNGKLAGNLRRRSPTVWFTPAAGTRTCMRSMRRPEKKNGGFSNSGKPAVREQGKAYMFSSPTIVGDVAFIGVLNGTLEARDAKTGELLWDFQVELRSKTKDGCSPPTASSMYSFFITPTGVKRRL
jgi:outer membrane protein assembly factor BamB